MRQLTTICLGLFLASQGLQSHALAMGPDEFASSMSLTCVLAQESLGYLSAEEYGDMTEAVLDGYDQAESDAIYAKALGYVDGLMFGLDAGNQREIDARLEEFVSSSRCGMNATVNLSL